MEEIRKFLLIISGLVIGLTTMILVMIYGWGLQAKSWWWIILGTLIGQTIAQIFIVVAKDNKKNKIIGKYHIPTGGKNN